MKHIRYLRFRCLLHLLFLFGPMLGPGTLHAQSPASVRGTFRDSSSGLPLPAGTVRILGTTNGTIANADGKYVLTLPPGNYTIAYSCLGYEPDTVRLVVAGTMTHDVFLPSSLVHFPEVVIFGEDPAIEIIRKAIAHKRDWRERLHAYQFDAFTRQVLWRDTAIASITESYTRGYQQVGDTLREVVLQKRQTQNIPMDENSASVRNIINFNDDEINPFSIRVNDASSGYTFVGPTAPDALDHYDYRLLRTSSVGGIQTYEIRMTPKSRFRPLFEGTIIIADETFAVIGVDLKPNETFVIPFLREIDLRFQQQFALYDSTFWMPADMRIHGGFTISIVGFSLPRIGIDQVSSVYRYEVNAQIPDSIFHKSRLTVDPGASRYDSTFWKATEVLPLTPQEQAAYKTLDSSQTLDKQFEPQGPLAAFGGNGKADFLEYGDAHFNRVEGFYFGGHFSVDRITPFMRVDGEAGAGFSDERIKYRAGTTVYPSRSHTFGLGGEVYRVIDHTPDAGFYGPFAISLMALIDKNDYRNYFYASGWRSFLTLTPSRNIGAELGFVSEQHYSIEAVTHYSFFSGNEQFRPNPSIDDGLLRSIRFSVRLGPEDGALDLVSRDALEFSAEHSSPEIAQSDFDFRQFRGMMTWSVPTFYQSLLFRPQLRIRMTGGVSSGSLPTQRLFSLDARSSGYAPFGVLRGSGVNEFGGDAFFMVSIEHNFRSLPFLLLNLPFLYRNGIDLVLHGSLAEAWMDRRSTTDGWYVEAGIGVSRIFDLLRVDLTYRLREPKRFFVSLGVANLF